MLCQCRKFAALRKIRNLATVFFDGAARTEDHGGLAQCGQFVHIACGEGHLLRRPISICAWKAPELRIVFQVKGEGTKWLSERKAGDELDVLGPLGHGFDVGHWATVRCSSAAASACPHARLRARGGKAGRKACGHPRLPQ